MGKLLFILGTYSCFVIILVIIGVLISFIDLDIYGNFVDVFNPILPALLFAMLVAEGLSVLMIILSYFKKTFFDLNDRYWKIGRIEAFVVAILLFLFYLASFILPVPPS